MKSTFARMICRFLIVALAMLPFQTGQASMIGTDQALSSAAAQADRDTVLNFLSRSETVSQLQSLGLDSQSAKDRVAAMTDDEVGTIAKKVHALPAGADGSGWALVILVVFVIWYFAFRR